jgi:hypothetical protein
VTDLKEWTVDDLVARYVAAASRHGAATLGSDASAANSDADVIAAVYRKLRRRGLQSLLLVLLDNADMGVRGWSAAHALEFAPSEGEVVLSALAESSEAGLIGFSAATTLREWHGGRLRFP